MKKLAFVFVVVTLRAIASSAADLDGDVLTNEIISDDLTAKGWNFLDSATQEFRDQGRGPFKKALLPFLIGVTLKAGSIVPAKLMIMTFIVVLALVFAKLGLAVSALVGYLQYQEAHKKTISAMTDKWVIPSTAHPPVVPSQDSLPSEPKPVVVPAPATSTQGPNTKRLQHYQQQPPMFDPYRAYDPFNADPYRFSRYDYPH